MSKLVLSDVANNLRSILIFLDHYVDADEARTFDQLVPILGDFPVDDIRSLAGFLVHQKFETPLSGITYQNYAIDTPLFSPELLIKSILASKVDDVDQRTQFMTELVRLISAFPGSVMQHIAIHDVSFEAMQRLNFIRLHDFSGISVPLGEFLAWSGISDLARHYLLASPEMTLLFLNLIPKGWIEISTMPSFDALVQRMKKLSNHISDKQEV